MEVRNTALYGKLKECIEDACKDSLSWRPHTTKYQTLIEAILAEEWYGMSIMDTKVFMLLLTQRSIFGHMQLVINNLAQLATAADYKRPQYTP